MTDEAGLKVPAALAEAINDCAAMIDAAEISAANPAVQLPEPFPSLLNQCRQLTDQLPAEPEPIRTLHHFACSGGTLIAKCLACMPNTQVLSEVEPFSPLQSGPSKGFHPTDLIQQLRHGSHGADDGLEAAVFLAGLKALYADCQRKGLRLVLRDHTHSHYCVGATLADTPMLRELVDGLVPVRAIVTVRHPLDSYLSVGKAGWLHFEPATLDEYCSRYLRFLDDYEGVPMFKYEDFVSAPAAEMEAMCEALGLPFAEGFEQLFSVHRLSGDSGRSAGVIAPRERRPVPDSVESEMEESEVYSALCRRLEYPLR